MQQKAVTAALRALAAGQASRPAQYDPSPLPGQSCLTVLGIRDSLTGVARRQLDLQLELSWCGRAAWAFALANALPVGLHSRYLGLQGTMLLILVRLQPQLLCDLCNWNWCNSLRDFNITGHG